MKREAKMWKRKNADQRVKRSFKTADEVLKVRIELLGSQGTNAAQHAAAMSKG